MLHSIYDDSQIDVNKLLAECNSRGELEGKLELIINGNNIIYNEYYCITNRGEMAGSQKVLSEMDDQLLTLKSIVRSQEPFTLSNTFKIQLKNVQNLILILCDGRTGVFVDLKKIIKSIEATGIDLKQIRIASHYIQNKEEFELYSNGHVSMVDDKHVCITAYDSNYRMLNCTKSASEQNGIASSRMFVVQCTKLYYF